ncbi:MAG TPA: hypothetical protein VMV09_03165 [Candidatus Saccharimonadales bacterium]|nr:hypothetical protein [Candidatus Saccharimonadales bacterium]
MSELPGARQGRWWSAIGPVPIPEPSGWLTAPHDRTRILDRGYSIGPLAVRPGGKRLVEYLALEPLALEGTTCFESWPLIVEGEWDEGPVQSSPVSAEELSATQGRWLAIEREVARDVRRLCSILALAWNEPWQVRTAPKQSSMLPPSVPDSRQPPSTWFDNGDYLETHVEALPDWVISCWNEIELDRNLQTALLSWHEGLLLTPNHPSFAHVAFLGAIEALSYSPSFASAMPKEIAPCSKCGATRTRSSQRFWTMVDQVASPNQVADLHAWEVVRKRGATAHGAGLHGIEESYGSVLLLDFVPPDTDQVTGRFEFNPSDSVSLFMFKVVPAVRDVARRLLLKALDRPPRAAASDAGSVEGTPSSMGSGS